jgi:hypothetical protein
MYLFSNLLDFIGKKEQMDRRDQYGPTSPRVSDNYRGTAMGRDRGDYYSQPGSPTNRTSNGDRGVGGYGDSNVYGQLGYAHQAPIGAERVDLRNAELRTVLVGGVPLDLHHEVLQYLRTYGSVSSSVSENSRSEGEVILVVQFTTEEAASRALGLHGAEFAGYRLVVQRRTSKASTTLLQTQSGTHEQKIGVMRWPFAASLPLIGPFVQLLLK